MMFITFFCVFRNIWPPKFRYLKKNRVSYIEIGLGTTKTGWSAGNLRFLVAPGVLLVFNAVMAIIDTRFPNWFQMNSFNNTTNKTLPGRRATTGFLTINYDELHDRLGTIGTTCRNRPCRFLCTQGHVGGIWEGDVGRLTGRTSICVKLE